MTKQGRGTSWIAYVLNWHGRNRLTISLYPKPFCDNIFVFFVLFFNVFVLYLNFTSFPLFVVFIPQVIINLFLTFLAFSCFFILYFYSLAKQFPALPIQK